MYMSWSINFRQSLAISWKRSSIFAPLASYVEIIFLRCYWTKRDVNKLEKFAEKGVRWKMKEDRTNKRMHEWKKEKERRRKEIGWKEKKKSWNEGLRGHSVASPKANTISRVTTEWKAARKGDKEQGELSNPRCCHGKRREREGGGDKKRREETVAVAKSEWLVVFRITIEWSRAAPVVRQPCHSPRDENSRGLTFSNSFNVFQRRSNGTSRWGQQWRCSPTGSLIAAGRIIPPTSSLIVHVISPVRVNWPDREGGIYVMVTKNALLLSCARDIEYGMKGRSGIELDGIFLGQLSGRMKCFANVGQRRVIEFFF